MNLLIVESPTKAKKIEKFIGPGWLVTASAGHIRDLPSNEMGVAAPDFQPEYVVLPDKAKTVAWLRKLVKDAGTVYLGTDLDREGEAIAWHLLQTLKPKNYWRVTFNEITKKAILDAIKSPREIDINRVKAQETRRVLDRIFGYYVSPWLTKIAGIGRSLSSGRVQSSALLLIVLRERAIA
ncbi:toprim domain-containing protein [Pseudomonas rhodesiae]|uniref:toprim domain-containing protein n=1 Tax=Pseudomonas rhodesiae TaxID=76760 RepID=UPI002404C2F8|nr:toprim domain-containing protein [Pseudomonas rhodesiae]